MRFVRYIELANIGTRGGTVPGAVATGRLAERAFRWAPGRYRSRYRTNFVWFDLEIFVKPEAPFTWETSGRNALSLWRPLLHGFSEARSSQARSADFWRPPRSHQQPPGMRLRFL